MFDDDGSVLVRTDPFRERFFGSSRQLMAIASTLGISMWPSRAEQHSPSWPSSRWCLRSRRLMAPSGGVTWQWVAVGLILGLLVGPAGPAVAEDVSGTPGDDVLTGTERGDQVHALAGDDIVRGLSGRDRLWGGSGDDVLNAGPGNDRFGGGTVRIGCLAASGSTNCPAASEMTIWWAPRTRTSST